MCRQKYNIAFVSTEKFAKYSYTVIFQGIFNIDII